MNSSRAICPGRYEHIDIGTGKYYKLPRKV